MIGKSEMSMGFWKMKFGNNRKMGNEITDGVTPGRPNQDWFIQFTYKYRTVMYLFCLFLSFSSKQFL